MKKKKERKKKERKKEKKKEKKKWKLRRAWENTELNDDTKMLTGLKKLCVGYSAGFLLAW